MKYYFLIHQEKLCAKSLKAESVIRVVVNVVNSILSKGLNHREFQDFLHNLETEFRDVVYYSEVRWLSRGKTLKRMFDLKEGGQTFAEGKGKRVAEFNDDEWTCDFAFIVDITIHLNELNTRLHGKGQLINSTSDHVEAFKMKLRLWESQLKNNNFVHIPTLLRCNGRDSQKYVRIISELREEFDTRFQVFKTLVSVYEAPGALQMECVDFQCATDLKHKCNIFSLFDFYKNYVSQGKYPGIHRHAVFMTSLFGSTYLCEQVFTRKKHVKFTTRPRLTDRQQESSLRVATSSITPNIGSFVREQQCQALH
ncbi:hypothetical protein Cfor_05725 [Coptotermes formosanus]|uniref:HAT C-terminal dimerisation domain-containing protein n=1 Tax=Coptotermes formosanus TaxID=36987 RepID=A0A6L2PWV9_COPFO|nr:hypothetical protein Cfor_05725 [Coptotermes formosanus]